MRPRLRRFEEQQRRIKAELEEEERRKREKDQKEIINKVETNLDLVQKRKNLQKGRNLDQPGSKKERQTSSGATSPRLPVVS